MSLVPLLLDVETGLTNTTLVMYNVTLKLHNTAYSVVSQTVPKASSN